MEELDLVQISRNFYFIFFVGLSPADILNFQQRYHFNFIFINHFMCYYHFSCNNQTIKKYCVIIQGQYTISEIYITSYFQLAKRGILWKKNPKQVFKMDEVCSLPKDIITKLIFARFSICLFSSDNLLILLFNWVCHVEWGLIPNVKKLPKNSDYGVLCWWLFPGFTYLVPGTKLCMSPVSPVFHI